MEADSNLDSKLLRKLLLHRLLSAPQIAALACLLGTHYIISDIYLQSVSYIPFRDFFKKGRRGREETVKAGMNCTQQHLSKWAIKSFKIVDC